MSLALFRKWLHEKTERVPSVAFGSKRLAFGRLRLADMATQRARLTPGCVADMCTTARDLRDPHVFSATFGKSYAIWRGSAIAGLLAIYPSDGSCGIWIATEHRGLGYGSEAVGSFLRVRNSIGSSTRPAALRTISHAAASSKATVSPR